MHKSRPVGDGREYQNLDALALQIAHQAIERQRDAVGNIICRSW